MNEWFIISMKYLKYKYIINPKNVKKTDIYTAQDITILITSPYLPFCATILLSCL